MQGDDEVVNANTDILVVEDDAFIRDYLTEILQASGYRVTSAASGDAALEILRAGLRPCLLFTDVLMAGGMTGIELARQSQLILPGLRVLYTSGYTGGDTYEPLPAGAPFLRKPFRRRACMAKIRDVLGPSVPRSGNVV